MAEDSKIQWTTHTFNPWRGCTKVSAGCANCYAESMSGRNPKVLGVWGKDGTRVVASEAQWRLPPKWDKAAALAGERHRVFCASLADVFEGPETMPAEAWPRVREARVRLHHLINDTPHLDWLLLTKRPENVVRFAEGPERSWTENMPPNVWLGASVENQAAADERIPHLLRVPAAVRFLSCEPLLGSVDLTEHLPHVRCVRCGWSNATDPNGTGRCPNRCGPLQKANPGRIDWCIVGGESGGGARPMNVEWARALVAQCRAAGVKVFVKQMGSNPQFQTPDMHGPQLLTLRDRKGGEVDEFPEDLRVREFPR